MTMAWFGLARLRMVLDALLGEDHQISLVMKAVNVEEYNLHDQGLKYLLSESITRWVRITLSDWFAIK